MQELKEIAVAVIFAVSIWAAIQIILNTTSPISGIVSCSLLPRYERGDLIILLGVPPSEIKAPEVELTPAEFAQIANVSHQNCTKTGVIEYICSQCPVYDAKTRAYLGETTCTKAVKIKNITIEENFSNDVIVYAPKPVIPLNGGIGDIIHRAFLKLKVGDKTYVLMKGDNNAYSDTLVFSIPEANERDRVQTFMRMVTFTPFQNEVMGKVILRVPWLGYFKLFISGYFEDPRGCEVVINLNLLSQK